MTDLIAELEAASEGSWALDMDVQEALGMPETFIGSKVVKWHRSTRGRVPQTWSCDTEDGYRHFDASIAPNFTASLDAAMALIPAGWMLDHLGDDAEGEPGSLRIFGATADLSNGAKDAQGQAPTRPLALVIAALKARLIDVG